MKSVKTKIMLLVLSCLLMSGIAIGGVGIINTKKVISVDSVYILNLLCAVRAEELNNVFSEVELSVETLKNYALSELEDAEQFKTDPVYVDNYSKKLKEVAVNAAKNTHGSLAVYIRFNPEFTNPRSGFFSVRLM